MRRVLPLAASISGLLLVSGCADADKAKSSDPPTAGAGGSVATRSGPGFAKEGWFGGADGLHARVAVKGVERQGPKTVLRYSVTSLDSAPKSVPFAIELLDPVGRRLYRPTGSTSGDNFAPGATREMAAEYPALPADVRKVTALTPGTAGEFTGIPVTVASGPPSTGSPSTGTPSGSGMPTFSGPPGGGATPPSGSGPPVASPPSAPGPSQPMYRAQPYGAVAPSPVTTSPSTGTSPPSTGTPPPSTGTSPPAGGSGPNPADLYDITEGETKDVTASGTDVTVNLRADVLFDTGSAKLSSRAKALLDEAAQQIKAKATRSLAFEGHTDSKGGDSDNLKLSKERAEAVMKEMKSRLGSGFSYSARGMGETQPVAREGGSDDAKARARNRRVEISYQVRQPAAGTGSPSATPGAATGAPAAFQAQDGGKVASRYGRFGAAKRRIDVKPFRRDGAYIVAVFDIVNEGPGATPPDASYPHRDYPGGVFTSFSIQAPGGKEIYRAVRVGPAAPGAVAGYVDPGRAVFRTAVNQPVRGFVYLPAPPGKVTSVVFDAGPFGKVDKVPVS